jgi:hypothetical protein
MGDEYEADFDYEAADDGARPSYLASDGGADDDAGLEYNLGGTGNAASKRATPGRTRFADEDDGDRGFSVPLSRVMEAPIGVESDSVGGSRGGSASGAAGRNASSGRAPGGTGGKHAPVSLAKREPTNKMHRAGPAVGSGLGATRALSGANKKPASGAGAGAGTGSGATAGGRKLGGSGAATASSSSASSASAGVGQHSRLLDGAAASSSGSPAKSPFKSAPLGGAAGGGAGEGAGAGAGAAHFGGGRGGKAGAEVDIQAVIRDRDALREKAEKTFADMREQTASLRERYEGMLAGKEKALKAAVRRAEQLAGQVESLKGQMTSTFQTDRMMELENAK